ncbi:MAG: hypothetical protein K2N38_10380 [Oscillospiraceae bacterium]|nr:hypothetical protein [Oscillospiraceae bacterium]
MFKRKFAAVLLAALLLLTGCAPKDDFDDYEFVEYPPVENVSARTEFEEYDGDVELISVLVTNDRDERFSFGYHISLQKDVDGEWRPIRIIKEEYDLLARYMPEHCTLPLRFDLNKYVKLPLLPGRYRIWVGNEIEKVPAEFTIK